MRENELTRLFGKTDIIIETPHFQDIIKRALAYLNAGYAVHFSGPCGTGKTTLALLLAGELERPVVVLYGNDEFIPSDLIGHSVGYQRKKVVDNFIHSVLKTEEDVLAKWLEGRITTACRNGYTLVYDEFTRSRPETNNVLLSVLEEKMITLPGLQRSEFCLKVHPNFRAIFTSNPEEYVGVHKTQDALRERMITIELNHFDRETELSITRAQSGLETKDVERIVDLVRGLRGIDRFDFNPSVRACIRIATIVKQQDIPVTKEDVYFRQLCSDVLLSEMKKSGRSQNYFERVRQVLGEFIDEYCC